VFSDDNLARSIRLRGFKGLWVAPFYYLDRGDALVHWKMNEPQLTTRVDSADSMDASEVGLVGQFSGQIGFSAGDFTAAHLSVSGAFPEAIGTDFSISGWVLCHDVSVNDATPIAKYRLGTDNLWEISTSVTKLSWRVSTNGVAVTTTVVSPWSLTNDLWFFVVAYRDNLNQTIGISVNNELFNTTACPVAVTDTGGTVRLGISGATAYFNGRVDSFTYWKRKLSQSDVKVLWNGGAGLDYPFP
jgi:hypothetical protein